MLDGSQIWSDSITDGLQKRYIGEKTVNEVYKFAPNSVYDGLRRNAEINGEKTAVIDNGNIHWSYATVHEKVDQMAQYLLKLLEKSDSMHVGTLMFTNIEFIVIYYACAKIGAVFVPLPTKYRVEEIDALIRRSDLSVLVVDELLIDLVTDNEIEMIIVKDDSNGYGFRHLDIPKNFQNIPTVNHDTPLIMMFTSGTTSLSKGVILTHYNIIHASIVYQRVFDLTSNDRTIVAVPSYHITGLSALISLFIHVGGTIVCHRFFDANKILSCIDDENITFMHGSPAVFKILHDTNEENESKTKLKSLTKIACGGSYTPVHHLKMYHEWLPHVQFRVVYGMTETSSPAFIFPGDAPTSIFAGASGKPIPGLCVRILDDDNQEVEIGEVGTIWIRGSVVTKEYYNMKTELFNSEGWLNTQDMGYSNDEGMIWVVDRKKDMINRGGEKIWPRDVEEAINRLPGVIESAVVGIEDSTYGEVAAAYVVHTKDETWNAERMQQNLTNLLATFKIPVKYIFSNEMPKTNNLKTDKAQIKKLF